LFLMRFKCLYKQLQFVLELMEVPLTFVLEEKKEKILARVTVEDL